MTWATPLATPPVIPTWGPHESLNHPKSPQNQIIFPNLIRPIPNHFKPFTIVGHPKLLQVSSSSIFSSSHLKSPQVTSNHPKSRQITPSHLKSPQVSSNHPKPPRIFPNPFQRFQTNSNHKTPQITLSLPKSPQFSPSHLKSLEVPSSLLIIFGCG